MAENTFRVKKSKIDNLTVDGDATLSGVNVSGDLAVNTDTLFVDSTNNRVGVGTDSPSCPLDVSGEVKITGDLTVDSTTLHVDSSNNRVGFGTASPSHPAHFVGSSTTSEYISVFAANGTTPEAGQISSLSSKGVAVQSNGGAYYFGRDPLNNIEFAMGTSSAGSVFSASFSNHDYQIRTNNTNRIHVESSNGNVGIGTTSPDASYKLDVAGDIRTQSAIDASDANLTLGSAITVDQAGGYVGIGNSSPSYALDIPFGDINVGGYVYTYDLDVGNNATISAGYLACSSFYDAGGSSQWGSESGGTFTFNGAVNIGGQAEATSQAASTDNSIMTRSLCDERYSENFPLWRTVDLRSINSSSSSGTGVTARKGNEVSGSTLYSPALSVSSSTTARYGFLSCSSTVVSSTFSNRYIGHSGQKRAISITFKPGAGLAVTTLGDRAMAIGCNISGTVAWDTSTIFPSGKPGWAVQLATSSTSNNYLAARLTGNQSSSQVTSSTSSETALYAANNQKIYKLVVVEEYLTSSSVRVTASIYDVSKNHDNGVQDKASALKWTDSIDITTINSGSSNYGGVQFLVSDNGTNSSSMQLSPYEIKVLDLFQ